MTDKIKHFLAGIVVATAAVLVWFLVSTFGAVEMRQAWLAALIAAAVAGAVKEAADAEDNKIRPGMHGVEILDALATAMGGVPVAAAVVLC